MPRALILMLSFTVAAACSPSVDEPQGNNVTENASTGGNVVGNDVGNGMAGEPADGMGDAKTADGYHATTTVPCGIKDKLDAECWAGVMRNEGPDGTSFVEVKKPDGMKRILFFQGTNASGADSSQADGSAAYRFKWQRDDDWTVIEYGPERYRIPDALVVGG